MTATRSQLVQAVQDAVHNNSAQPDPWVQESRECPSCQKSRKIGRECCYRCSRGLA